MPEACKYSDLCRKMEMTEQPAVSYWPRDEGLMDYCAGNDSERCSVYGMWEENPEMRERVRSKHETSLPIGAVWTAAGGGQMIYHGPGSFGFYMGCLFGLGGLGFLANGLTRRFAGKGLKRWIESLGDRDGLEELYSKMEDISDEWEGAELEVTDMFGAEESAEAMLKNISYASGIILDMRESASCRWRGTSFKAGKLHVSYPLTQDSSLMGEKDVGIVTAYDYEQYKCSRHGCNCGNSGVPTKYSTGVIAPVIHRKKVSDGMGFIQGMNHHCFPIPVPIAPGSDDPNSGPKLGIPVSTSIDLRAGKIRDVFGDQRLFDAVAKDTMEEKQAIDARNVHRLLQEALYSDF
ncbi:MAG: hypothetical protein DRO99_02275 [Candidatus Aenigmatarchaeota archaeon]|nr:MAG: hypothetical protein DRO99_02275 [Candidatus Aenigmarchaeota archaeon]